MIALSSHTSMEKALAPTPVLLPGKFHGRRSLGGYSPWSREESDTTEQLNWHIKVFAIVNKAEVDFFWNSLASSMIQQMLAIWFLVPLPFLNPAWTSGNSQFTYCWSLAWRILRITLLLCEMRVSCVVVWAFFGIAFLRDWNENWPFPVLWTLLSFPNLLAYWVQHFHSIIFQVLK